MQKILLSPTECCILNEQNSVILSSLIEGKEIDSSVPNLYILTKELVADIQQKIVGIEGFIHNNISAIIIIENMEISQIEPTNYSEKMNFLQKLDYGALGYDNFLPNEYEHEPV